MYRTRLVFAAGAAALIAGAALAQDSPAPQDPPFPEQAPEVQPTPESPEVPAPEPEVRDVEAATAAGTPAAQAEIQAQAQSQAQGDVIDVLRREGEFSTLVSALEASGLVPVIEGNPDITIFAPTDTAFAALPPGELERLMQPANVDELRALLLYHLINADVRPDQILNRRGAVMTGGGAEIMLDGAGGQIRADAATVTRSDLRGSNGAVFVIDQVLDPEQSLAENAPTQAEPAPPASAPDAPPPAPAPAPAEAGAPQNEAAVPPVDEPAASPPPTESPATQEIERPPGAHPPVDDAPDEDDLDEPGAA